MPTKPDRRKPSGRTKAKTPPTGTEPAKTGRPSSYTPEAADFICARIATSKDSLRTICESSELPDVITVFRWLRSNETFRGQYNLAKEQQGELLVEEILSIADDGANDTYLDAQGNKRVDNDVIQRSRLRVDARKWLASKLIPKKYGDKMELTGEGAKTSVTVNVNLPENRRAAIVDRRRAAMQGKN